MLTYASVQIRMCFTPILYLPILCVFTFTNIYAA